MDKAAVEAALRAAELTDAELDQYKQRAAVALAKMQGKSGRAAQSDAETLSAHSAIASFTGVSNWASGGVAAHIDRYLKYAHIAGAPGLGSSATSSCPWRFPRRSASCVRQWAPNAVWIRARK